MTSANSVLKSSARRSTASSGRERAGVVKRFHSPGLRRWGDRRRARRELRYLRLAHAAGLAVPRPHGVSREDGCWTLSMDPIPGARPLAELFDSDAAERAPAKELARRTGRLLADLARAGLEHGDLHPGNLLVDRAGTVWAIDFQRARRRRSASSARRDLVTLCGAVRERTALEVRAAGIRAWLERVEEGVRPRSPAALLVQVEREARRDRRRAVERHLGRWLRESGAAETVGELELLAARGLSPRDRDRAFEPPKGIGAVTRGDRRLVRAERRADTLRLWLSAARLLEHRLAGLRPVRLDAGPAAVAELAVPSGARPLAECLEAVEPRRLARQLGALLALVRDRGLEPVALGPEVLWIGPGTRLAFDPSVRLRDRELASPREEARAVELTGALEPLARGALRAELERSFHAVLSRRLASVGEASS